MQRRSTSFLILSVLLVASAACGDGGGDDGAAEATTTTAPSATNTSLREVTLIDDGVDLPMGVVEFGTPMDEAVSSFAAAFGDPDVDRGMREPKRPYGRCPGPKVRALEYFGGALELLFGVAGPGSDDGQAVFHSWVLTSEGDVASAPKASVLIGDVTTFDFGVGTRVDDFEEGLSDIGGYEFETFEGADGASFVVSIEGVGNDPAPGSPPNITGQLSNGELRTSHATLVEGGLGCNET